MLNSIIKQKWIDALRSGLYIQGFGGLRRVDNKYCCLGVLCDLYIQEHTNLQWTPGEDGFYLLKGTGGIGTSDTSGAWLPSVVRDWIGVEMVLDLRQSSVELNLMSLNDGHRASFDVIADTIQNY